MNYKKAKPIIDSCAYLVKQIELCESKINEFEGQLITMQSLNDNGFVFPYEEKDFKIVREDIDTHSRQREQFINQLAEAIKLFNDGI